MLDLSRLDEEIAHLPPLPAVVIDVMASMNGESFDFGVFEKKVSQDPVMVGRILSVANSSFYGLSGKVGSVKGACLVIGINTLRSIVVAIGVIKHIGGVQEGPWDQNGFWHHSLRNAIVARVLAQRVELDQEEAFTAGLLHDIGEFMLVSHFGEQYGEVANYCNEAGLERYEAEEAVLGCTHGYVGARIAEKWNLPRHIIDCIRDHHTPVMEVNEPLTDLVRLSDTISMAMEVGEELALGTMLDDCRESLKRLGLEVGQVAGCFDEVSSTTSGFSVLLE